MNIHHSTKYSSVNATAAKVAFYTAILFLALLGILHVIEPEFAPSWRFVSEYSNGNYGWVNQLSFFAMGTSCASLAIAVWPQIQSRAGRTGLILLVAVAASMIMAGIFAIDPITSKPNQLTAHGHLHGFASMIGVPGLPIAALLTYFSLKRNPFWSPIPRMLIWATHITWIAVLLMFVYMGITLPKVKGFGPDVLIGYFNRIVIMAYGIWLITFSTLITRLTSKR